MASAPEPPAGLATAGKALWRRILKRYDLDRYELEILTLACRQVDDVARLEQLIAKGLIVTGSKGQPRLSAAVTEVRQSRLAVARLLGQIAIPVGFDDDGPEERPVSSAASERGRRAARARWSGRGRKGDGG